VVAVEGHIHIVKLSLTFGTLLPLQVAELSLLQAKLPEEILTQILSKLPSLSLGLAQCVCKQFRSLCCTDTLWRPASVEAFWQEFSREAAPVASIHALVRSQYR
jgi:hypothetical protein